MAVPNLLEFLTKRRETAVTQQHTVQPGEETPGTVTEIPKIDRNNVLGSLTGILGPSPEERAAEEQRLQEHRRKMHGWTALFNGLRHLGNLYYAAKGAPGQKLSDPHQQIEQQYQEERKRLADIQDRNQKYYANLWGLYRQMSDEQRRNTLAEAQAQYYGTRDEMARQKAELDKLKAVRVIKQKDGSLMKFDPVTGELDTLSEADPLYQEYVRSQINRNNRTGTGTSGSRQYKDNSYETVSWEDEQGRKHTRRTDGRFGGTPQPARPTQPNSSGTQRTVKGGGSRQIKGYRRNGASSSGSGKGNGY